MLTHKNIAANTYSICSYLQLTEKDIQMVVVPSDFYFVKSLPKNASGKVNRTACKQLIIKQLNDLNSGS